mmetsp:Transcript_22125/g.32978  ORF Transcript_22125/g.32978 Transcript_22125/m.32978 type:complete len:100 (-) Transcript_22125:100-399(-)
MQATLKLAVFLLLLSEGYSRVVRSKKQRVSKRSQKWRHFVGKRNERTANRPVRKREILRKEKETKSGIKEIHPYPWESHKAFRRRVQLQARNRKRKRDP